MLVIKSLPANAGDIREVGLIPGSRRSPRRRAWQPTPIFLPRKSHGQRSLAGYSPWGLRVRYDWSGLTIHTQSGGAPREGNSNPLQYSCLENLMDRGAWWVTVDGVAKSWIQLKRLNNTRTVRRSPLRRKWQPTQVFLPEKSHGWWSLVDCSPCGCERVGLTIKYLY